MFTKRNLALCAARLALAALALPVALAAGEKIRFSSPLRDEPAPLADPKEKQMFKPTGGLDNFRPAPTEVGQIPFVPATVTKLGPKKRGAKDEDDPATERREWIFNNVKEVEGRGLGKPGKKDAEKRELDDTEKEDKTAMEEFFESRANKQKNSDKDGKAQKEQNENLANNPALPFGPDANSANPRPTGLRDADGSGSLARQRGNTGLARAEGGADKVAAEKSALRETFGESRPVAVRGERQMERESRMEEFSRLLNSAPGAPSAGLGAPLNFSSGSAFQPGNPLGQSSFDAMLGKSPASSLPGALPGAGNLKPAALEDLGAKPAADISAPPVLFTPPAQSEIIAPQRAPVILEMPKRKF